MLSAHRKDYEETAAGGVSNVACGCATLALPSLNASCSGTQKLRNEYIAKPGHIDVHVQLHNPSSTV